MKGYIKLLIYVKPYKVLAALNVFFNILSIVFSLFSIAVIMPFLKLLFAQEQLVKEKPTLSMDFKNINDVFNYYLSELIRMEGPESALIFICIILVLTIVLKNLFSST